MLRAKKAAHASQSTLFLMELIVSVAYMALSSAVCVRLYLYAHSISKESAARTHAVTEVQNIFTGFRTGSGILEDTVEKYLETTGTSQTESAAYASSVLLDTVTFFYDADWNLVSAGSDEVSWEITLTLSDDDDTPGLQILSAVVTDSSPQSEDTVYTSSCSRYDPHLYTEYLNTSGHGEEVSG